MDLHIQPLSPKTLNNYLSFFDNMVFTENPEWSECYCFSYHFTGTKEQWNRDVNRSSVIEFVNTNKMTGYLAFHNNKPIGWCNANNRLKYQRLLKYHDIDDSSNQKVCSIVCFLIHPEYRRKGIAQKILARISDDYASKNYDYLEAYPKKGKLSCEGHYNGPLELYRKLHFEIVNEYDDYYLVRKKL